MISLVPKIPQIYCQITNPRGLNNNNGTIATKNKVICKDNIRVKTLDGCKLCISSYNFDYNAQGGKGAGRKVKVVNNHQGHCQDDQFVIVSPVSRYEVDVNTVHIPTVNTVTAKVDGWAPFPPFVEADIVPELLHGSICEKSGKVEYKLRAKILICIGSSYKSPPLVIDTVLTSEETIFRRRRIRGKRLGQDGKCKLVGVAKIDPTQDHYINSLLGLPSKCLASLNVAMFFL